MFHHLINQLHNPVKFTESEKMFWKDPHIANYLLEAHLDSNHDGASRSSSFINKSVEFILREGMKKESKKIIDYGCGPGLYCERLAKKGLNVTGIDFSENSIEYAKKSAETKGLAITYRYENYLDSIEKPQYDFATLIYCDYGAISSNNRKKLLRNIWNSLQEGGRFLLDVFTEHKFHDFKEGNTWYVRQTGGFWSSKPYIEMNQNVKYDGIVSLEQTTILSEQEIETYYIWNQYFTKEMIVGELEEAGFTIVSIYNNVAGESLIEGNDTIALLAEK